jgi:hypothetical protein
MADEQELNSVDRFRKKSDRLLLEEYSHCEVPAGCGGVVFRWRNPFSTIPIRFTFYCPVQTSVLVDGVESSSTHIDLIPGKHVLGLHLSKAPLDKGLLFFACSLEDDTYKTFQGIAGKIKAWSFATRPDKSWKFSLVAPDEKWLSPDFDDSQWASLITGEKPQLKKDDWEKYRIEKAEKEGATCLGLPKIQETDRSNISKLPETSDVWIRRTFELPTPE